MGPRKEYRKTERRLPRPTGEKRNFRVFTFYAGPLSNRCCPTVYIGFHLPSFWPPPCAIFTPRCIYVAEKPKSGVGTGPEQLLHSYRYAPRISSARFPLAITRKPFAPVENGRAARCTCHPESLLSHTRWKNTESPSSCYSFTPPIEMPRITYFPVKR